MLEEENILEPETAELTQDSSAPDCPAPDGPRPLEDDEVLAFLRQYPELEPREIPGSVWAAVSRGTPLAEAYGYHERSCLQARNRELERQLAVLQRNERSRSLSVGSMRSYGSGGGYDAFMAGFDEA